MLSFKYYRPVGDKVFKVEFHPTQPWALSATKSDFISVWDWRNQQVLHKLQLGQSGEDELFGNADLAKLHLKDESVAVNPSIAGPSTSRSAAGKVRDVRFLDQDVAAAQLAANHALAEGSGAPAPTAAQLTDTFLGQRLVVVVCEYKVLLWDLGGRTVKEIPKAAFDGKQPTCCAFLFLSGQLAGAGKPPSVMSSPVLAFGCSDGQGGSVTCWEPLAKPLGVGRGMPVPHKGDYKAHDKEVVGVAIAAVDEGPEGPKSLVLSAGVDARLMAYEAPSLKEVMKHKLDNKAPAVCMAYNPRGYTASNTHCLLIGTDVGLVLAVHPVLGSLRLVANLTTQVPHGGKKLPKIYCIAVHPLQPQHVMVATNTGIVLYGLEVLFTPPAVVLPLISPSQVLDNNGEGVTFVTAVGDAVFCVTATANPEGRLPEPPPKAAEETAVKSGGGAAAPSGGDNLLDLLDDSTPLPAAATPATALPGTPGAASSAPSTFLMSPADTFNRPTAVKVLQATRMASARPASRAVLAASCDGSYVSVTWPIAKQFSIFMRKDNDWNEICAGAGTSVAWHACEPRFAVVEAVALPAPAPAATPSKGGLFKSSKAAAKEAERARAAAEAAANAAALAASTPAQVQVRVCAGTAVSVVHAHLPMSPQDAAIAVTGGPLLSVTLRRQLNGAAGLYPEGEVPNAMQLYDWGGGKRVGVELPQPLIVSWDPTFTLVALAYPSQVLICTAQPSIQPVASLPISNATGIEWGLRQVYIATCTHIYMAFLTLPDTSQLHPPAISVQLMLFACFGAPQPPVNPPPSDFSLSAAPVPLPRPPGPLTLLGPRDGYLWVVNAHAQPVALPLTKQPGVRVLCIAANGEVATAVETANTMLHKDQHAMVSAVLCDMHGLKGAQAALYLQGLPLHEEAKLRIKLHHWAQAMEVVEAMLAGFTHRPARSEFSFPVTSASFNLDSSTNLQGGPLDMASFAHVVPATARAYADDLDWWGPVRNAASNAATHSARSAAGETRPSALQSASPVAVSYALALLHELKGIGMSDAARNLVHLVISHSSSLSADQMLTLVTMMSELGMRQDLPQLVNGVGLGAEGGSKESLGMLAALLSGHSALVKDVLGGGAGSAGNASLAAAHAMSFCREESEAQPGVTAWHDMLRDLMVSSSVPGVPKDVLPCFKLEQEVS